ncbi:hypothetical protein IP86_15795 [Rhodopseudomonas sp. AAP120]|uniref:hypothetical protein n=1 Tax=Rhodopseudomonas sp. AAP120 TaxID=1523430 RepID=UPI0006B8FC2A|nr:hypothetical protein [Rhodopseudomonas sp. AAP120]KPF96749.1 hypothetical protein IP86_15795 [Rhodopseudomonas sp. AAP120]
MKNHRLSVPDDDEHRVLQFRPRTSPKTAFKDSAVGPIQGSSATRPQQLPPLDNDLSRYERTSDASTDDFRHRMMTNLAALAFTVALTVIGFWLATSIADMRRTQDCVLMGRRDCANIPTPQG